MKLFELFQKRKKQKLLATTSRGMSQAGARASDEPNMKLSSAVLVVLILHLVAVGGIYAFSSIKAHRIAESPEPVEKKENFDGTAKKNATAPDATSASKVQRNASALPDKSSDSSPKKSATTSSKNALKDSGETYIVAKGDKLAAIAKKLKVNADDLLKLNKIDDPKTLQIGRKLRIPVKRQPSDS